MQKLAKREEQIMQVLWQLEKAFVKEIIDELPDPKPHFLPLHINKNSGNPNLYIICFSQEPFSLIMEAYKL